MYSRTVEKCIGFACRSCIQLNPRVLLAKDTRDWGCLALKATAFYNTNTIIQLFRDLLLPEASCILLNAI
jgi:hypothetical protein